MTLRKLSLFSASLILFAASAALAQKAAQAVTAPQAATAPRAAVAVQAQTAPAIAIATSGGNYLGVTTVEVTRENMARYNMREPRGVAITRVADASPAARAGLKAGDVILRFDGEQVTTFRKLQRLIDEAQPEQNVRLTISRNGSEQEVSVTLGTRKDAFESLSKVYGMGQGTAEAQRALERMSNRGLFNMGWGRRIGVSTTELTRQLADYFGVAGGRGVLITSVTENSPAARAGLKAGDIITDVDGEKVESAGDLSRAINRKNEGDVTLTVVRDRSPRTIRVTPEKREPGAISISPDVFQIEPGEIEITMPTIDISMPGVKITPIKIKPIKIQPLKIKPEQLQKLESLMIL